jgi:hypothetical protein
MSALGLLVLTPFAGFADIRFDDVTQSANITFVGPTNGASWGDVNSDGYPDLFAANHRLEGNEVSLYLNRGDGTFEDIGPSLAVGRFADLHGVAWADFDNDGDQDLMALAGGGAGEADSEGEWSYPNHLFRNDDGRLVNVAAEYGVEYPQGRGRTPLWLDADLDGRLDVLFVNAKRPDRTWPSVLFVQRGGKFVEGSAEHGFTEDPPTRVDRYLHIAENLWNLRWRRGPDEMRTADVFAQLADVHGDRALELLVYTDPFRIYSTESASLSDITNDVVFPDQRFAEDIVIADFNGDASNDLFVLRTRAQRWWNRMARPSPVVQVDARRIEGIFVTSPGTPPQQVHFTSTAPVRLALHPQWVTGKEVEKTLPTVRVGSTLLPGGTLELEVDRDQAVASEAAVPTEHGEVSLRVEPASGHWILQSTEQTVPRINFVLESMGELELVAIAGYERADGRLPAALLIKEEDEFVAKALMGHTAEATACLSAVGGDFDNDMDVDLFLVCTDPVDNTPDRLYENDGQGGFSLVPEAGGATGAEAGRGDSVVTADYDRDGFLDLFVLNGAGAVPFGYDGPHQLFRNRGNGNHWIEIDLEGVRSNRDGIGAVVEVSAGGVTQVRDQGGGMHNFSQNHQRLHFGLAENEIVDEITVYWPSGVVQRLQGIEPNQLLSIEEL